jgi:O-antigen chain-terminating methyltransferase
MARQSREEMKVIEALSQSLPTQSIREIHQAVLVCKRQVQVSAAQSEIEYASLREEISELKYALKRVEARAMDHENGSFAKRIDRLAQRLDAETAQKEQTAARLSELEELTRQTTAALTQRLDAETARLSELEQFAHQTTTALTQRLDAETARLSEVEQFAHQTTTALTQRLDAETAQKDQTAARVSELGLYTYQTRTSLSIQDRRLALFMEEARKRLPEPLAQDQLQGMVNHDTQHRYDSLYAAFEDVFRGSREDIKARQSVYLPLLKEHAIGAPAMPVLDLGCGRGEWIELLGEHGLEARGVDSNDVMVERCKSLGLPVLQNDALSYLGSLPDACIGAITSFHMVEHMPFDVIMTLIDESLRVLKPGGIVILETPNPANFQVGAYTFHFDPTHLKPLPSPTLRFAVEARGFCDVHVRELHPYPEVLRFADDGKGIASRLNDYLYGPQDYAVIGRKP